MCLIFVASDIGFFCHTCLTHPSKIMRQRFIPGLIWLSKNNDIGVISGTHVETKKMQMVYVMSHVSWLKHLQFGRVGLVKPKYIHFSTTKIGPCKWSCTFHVGIGSWDPSYPKAFAKPQVFQKSRRKDFGNMFQMEFGRTTNEQNNIFFGRGELPSLSQLSQFEVCPPCLLVESKKQPHQKLRYWYYHLNIRKVPFLLRQLDGCYF